MLVENVFGTEQQLVNNLVADKRNTLNKRKAKSYLKDFIKASQAKDNVGEIKKMNMKYDKYFKPQQRNYTAFVGNIANFATFSPFSRNLVNAKKTIKTFGDNNPLGKFFLKDANKVKTYSPDGKLIKKTNGLLRSGKTFSNRGLLVAAAPVVGLAGLQTKKVYDDYSPKIKAARKLNTMINNVTDKFNNNK